MNKDVYILLPSPRHEQKANDWYMVKQFKAAFERYNIYARLICIDDYTPEELSHFPEPLAAVFIHVFTHEICEKYSDTIKIINKWKNVLVNDCEAHYNVSNKLKMYDILSQNNIYVAKTFGFDKEELTEKDCNYYFNELGSPLVLKAAFGFTSISAMLCYNTEELKAGYKSLRDNPLTYRSPAVIQKYVDDYSDMVIRVYVTPDHMGGYLSLVSPFEKVKFNNFNLHKFRIPYKVEKRVEDFVRNALKCLNINVCCCDVLIDGDELFLADVNSIGNFKMYDSINNTRFVDEIVKYMMKNRSVA